MDKFKQYIDENDEPLPWKLIPFITFVKYYKKEFDKWENKNLLISYLLEMYRHFSETLNPEDFISEDYNSITNMLSILIQFNYFDNECLNNIFELGIRILSFIIENEDIDKRNLGYLMILQILIPINLRQDRCLDEKIIYAFKEVINNNYIFREYDKVILILMLIKLNISSEEMNSIKNKILSSKYNFDELVRIDCYWYLNYNK